jgi:uncharacterized cupin superfamily protein
MNSTWKNAAGQFAVKAAEFAPILSGRSRLIRRSQNPSTDGLTDQLTANAAI